MEDGAVLIDVRKGGVDVRSSSGDLVGEAPRRSVSTRPFLKWTGGKQWLAPYIPHLLPEGFCGRYFEPFLGGGSVFFGLGPSRATLSDINPEVIVTYEAIRDDVDAVVAELKTYKNDREFYDRMRASRPRVAYRRAARALYLNRTAFSGMYRVNRRGDFNVPFGDYKNPMICPESRLRTAAIALEGITIRTADFGDLRPWPEAGDLVYIDPPYTTGHRNNGFIKYNARLFSWEDQQRLAVLAKTLNDEGVHVLVSNADHPALDSLYSEFQKSTVRRKRLIGGTGARRGEITEALLSNYEVFGELRIARGECG